MQQKELENIMTTTELIELRKRNSERVEAAKTSMGSSWLCHPANQTQRLTPRSPVLTKGS